MEAREERVHVQKRGGGNRVMEGDPKREEPVGKGQPSPLGWKVQGWSMVCQIGTEECWENLEARSALICKMFTTILESAIC